MVFLGLISCNSTEPENILSVGCEEKSQDNRIVPPIEETNQARKPNEGLQA